EVEVQPVLGPIVTQPSTIPTLVQTTRFSDSGRQGMSQVQRWGGEYDDGAITGAPAFRYGQQQTAHMFPVVVEQTLNYYPPPCELDQIVTAIIAACDPLNGRTD
ncbi:hypothetical protein ACHAPF_011534, partial [Botrytis cinerea]